VDFGSTEPFSETSAYVGCLVARRRAQHENSPATVRVIEVKSLTPVFVAAALLEAETLEDSHETDIVRSYIARHPRGGAPWILLSNAERRSHILLSDASDGLDMHAAVYQGIRTGATDIYIVDPESTDEERLCRVVNGLGEDAIIEIDLLEPVIYGADVQRYSFGQKATSVSVP
jgi:hypothetical protein